MNRQEFMKELESLLTDIPESERTEALKYYDEYFSDAGEENEQNVISELESPKKVADNIKEGLPHAAEEPQAEQSAGQEAQTQTQQNAGQEAQTQQPWQESGQIPQQTEQDIGQEPKKGISKPLLIGCIIGSPLILAAAALMLGLFVAAVSVEIALIVSFGAIAIALVALGVLVIVVGCGMMTAGPFVGVAVLGSGILMISFTFLCIMLLVLLSRYALPATCKGFVQLCKSPFKK